jgi:hypothetical protein
VAQGFRQIPRSLERIFRDRVRETIRWADSETTMTRELGNTTLGRAIVTLAVLGLLSSSVSAQVAVSGSLRVRITGPDLYEIPGVLSIAGDHVTGSVVTSADDAIVQVRLPQTTELVTVPKAGRHLVGLVLSVDNNAVVLARKGQSASLRIPLDAIGKVEVSEGRRHGRATAILAGIGAWYGTGALFVRLSDFWFYPGPLAVAPAVGMVVGYLLGREHWKAVPVASLRDRVGQSSSPRSTTRDPD